MTIAADIYRRCLTDQEGRPLEIVYRSLKGMVCMEGEWVQTYGIEIETDAGDRCAVGDITPDKERALALLELVYRMEVTPATLQDIVQDYIEN